MSPAPVHHLVGGVVHVAVSADDPADARTVERQLGPAVADPGTAVDLLVAFVPRLAIDGERTWAGYRESSFDRQHFYLHETRPRDGGGVALARTPLDRLGAGADSGAVVEVESGARVVPLLVAMVNLLALGKGVVPVHASTVVHRGTTVLACGWSKGGKTEMMVSLERLGATYVADEWSYLRRVDGRTHSSSLPEPVRVWNWQLDQLPELRARVTNRSSRARLSAYDRAARGLEWLGRSRAPGRHVWRRAAPVVARQAYVQVPPLRLFDGRVAPAAAVDQVLLVHSWVGTATQVSEVTGREVAARMVHSLAHERMPFTSVYQQFRFAFPDRVCELADRASGLEAELLRETLEDLPAHRLVHPYPADLAAVAAAIESVLD